MLRVNWQTERLERELAKLLNRLYKTDLARNAEAVEVISRHVMGGEAVDAQTLLHSVEGLFLV
ncbi:MAG: hypothetical protein IJZ66_07480, partial [Oscillibacter sp.]|nr:hypothetical protein [Oscillibacter sp.]